MVTIIGLQTGLLLSGAILTETVFAIPGMGTWLAGAIEDRDYPVLQGGILFVALVFVIVNLLVDISYGVPRPAHPGELSMSVAQLESAEIELEAPSGLWSDAWRRLIRNPGAIVGFVLVALFVLTAVFAPLIAPYDPRDRICAFSRTAAVPGRRRITGSASTSSAATSSPASSTERASRS